jgi:hypothetical protein
VGDSVEDAGVVEEVLAEAFAGLHAWTCGLMRA